MVLGLSRMEELLHRLGDPQDTLNVIHVAGTNGKGSVSKYLEEGLSACGYKMGLYTSPYIEKFNERIRFDGADISDADLEYYGQKVIDAAEAMVADGKDSPTEFEVVTAIAFLYFAGKKADITILEVGLGGMGDSTNVVKHPMASVITSISYDHMAQLGNTLAEIAVNKAGIIKTGCPVISNVPERDAAKIIARKAYAMGSRLAWSFMKKATATWRFPWQADIRRKISKRLLRHWRSCASQVQSSWTAKPCMQG